MLTSFLAILALTSSALGDPMSLLLAFWEEKKGLEQTVLIFRAATSKRPLRAFLCMLNAGHQPCR